MIDYRVYTGIGDTIKTGFQEKQAFSKKAATWMLVFAALSMTVGISVLEISAMA